MDEEKNVEQPEKVERVIEREKVVKEIPEEYKPISMWGYFGYEILFAIPCIGIILLLVFSFGGAKNVNLKNFARSYFCFLIVGIVLIFLLSAMLGVEIFTSV